MNFIKRFLIFCMVFGSISISFAQVPDTVLVPPTLADGTNADAIRTAMTDPANIGKVFKLQRGGLYMIIGDAFQAVDSVSVTIIGEKYPADQPPAVIQRGGAEKGGINWHPEFTIYADNVIIKNVAFNGYSPETWSILGNIGLSKNDGKVLIDNCLFQGGGWGALWFPGSPDSLILKNCLFINGIDGGWWAQGHPINSWGGKPKNAVIVNNTFACMNGVFAQKPHDNYIFDHNTVVMENREPFFPGAVKNEQITNNILYDVGMRGYVGFRGVVGGDTIYAGDWIDGQQSLGNSDSLMGMMDILTNIEGVDDATRSISFENNMLFTSSTITDYHASIGATTQPLINDRTDSVFTANAGMVNSGNIEMIDPDFIQGIPDTVYDNYFTMINRVRGFDTTSVRPHWTWNFNGDAGPYTRILVWPIPMDLKPKAAQADGAGTDGYPLGDLNWWGKDVVAAWEAGETYTGIDKIVGDLPIKFVLSQNYPNPFNPTTNIRFSIPEKGLVTLNVFNVLGQKVAQLVDTEMNPGNYKVDFNASQLTSGIYFYTLESGNFNQTQKMMLIK